MLDQLDASDFVLVVCTETYYRRFRGHEEPGKGKGADWEGALITREIYDSRSTTLKFVPILLSADQEKFIPEPLRSLTYYLLTSESAYKALYDSLVERAAVEPGRVARIKAGSRRKGSALTFNRATSTTPPTPRKERKQVRKGGAAKQAQGAVELYRGALRLLADGKYDAALHALDRV